MEQQQNRNEIHSKSLKQLDMPYSLKYVGE